MTRKSGKTGKQKPQPRDEDTLSLDADSDFDGSDHSNSPERSSGPHSPEESPPPLPSPKGMSVVPDSPSLVEPSPAKSTRLP